MVLTKRSPALVLILSLLTGGIYYYYWVVVTTNEIEGSLQQKDGTCSSGGMALLFSLITCGIYTIYWYFKEAKRVHQIGQESGVNVSDNSTLFIILLFVGFGWLAPIFLQGDLNKIVLNAKN